MAWTINWSMIWGRGVAVLALALLWAASTGVARAQTEPDAEPPWKKKLSCDPAHQVYQGLAYCTGLGGRAHVLVVDLHDSAGLQFEYIMAEGADRHGSVGPCRDVNLPAWSSGPGCFDTATGTFPIMSLQQAVARVPGAAAVFDTDYGAKSGGDRGHGPEGLTIVNGERFDGPRMGDTDHNAVNRPWLALGRGAPLPAVLGQLTADSGDKPFGWIDTAVGGAPWLIRDGALDTNQITNCTAADGWSCQSAESQAAVGLSRGGRWLYVVVADEVDAMGIATFMRDNLAPWSAIKFDGGGSTQMWYGGLPEPRIAFAESNRNLSQYMAIMAAPGGGVAPESPLLRASVEQSSKTIVLDEGETVTLAPTFRNDGDVVWTIGDVVLVRRPAVNSPFGRPERVALPHDVAPGSSVSWSFPAESGAIRTYRYQLAHDHLYFGPQQQIVVIVVPAALQEKRDELEAFIADLQAQGVQEAEELAAAVEQWLLIEGTQIAEGIMDRIGQWLSDLAGRLLRALEAKLVAFCNSLLLIPVALAVVWRRRR